MLGVTTSQVDNFMKSLFEQQKNTRVLTLLCLGLCALSVIGCGYQTYETRLGETVKYFEFRDKVNRALVPESGSFNEFGINFRAPRTFQLMPAPPPRETDEEGNPIGPVPRDNRQPNFFQSRVVLPEILGAWRGVLPVNGVENPNNASYIYIMGNYNLHLANELDNNVDPLGLIESFANSLRRELGMQPPGGDEGESNGWGTEKIPLADSYVLKKLFETQKFQGRANGQDAEFQCYLHEPPDSDIQVVIMFVIPANLDRPGQLAEALDYSLQTMTISPAKPSNRTGGAPAAGF